MNKISLASVWVGLGAGFMTAQTPPPSTPRTVTDTKYRTAGDLLILRSGQVQKGALKTCVSSRCQLGTSSVSRDQIAWIGFSTAIASPPAITD